MADVRSAAEPTVVVDGATRTIAASVKTANTLPLAADSAQVVSVSPNNTGLPVNLPVQVQATNNKSTGSVASLAKAFASNVTVGNTLICVCGVGNGTAPTVTDGSNTWKQAAQIANSTALNVSVFFAVNAVAGATTVTVNNGGSTASIAMEIYEYSGLLAQNTPSSQPGVNATNTGTSGTASTTSALVPEGPNVVAFAAVGVGTAAQTITPSTGWTNDSGQQNPTTPAGLFSFISMSQAIGSLGSVTTSATFTSEPWAIAVATFRPVFVPVEGTVNALQSGTWTVQPGNTANTSAWLMSERPATTGGNTVFYLNAAATTNATVVKASAGQVYGIMVTNTNAALRYLVFHNAATTPTAGAAVYFKIGIPGASAGAGNNTYVALGAAFSTGIAITTVTGVADSNATAVTINDLLITIFYT